ncbi:MAG: peptide chain release factor-like protein [Gammaproteobacteria bacterium]|nr:peptide chain release factor-like protein [Gammaproteobacteria bacterium]NIR25486.1 peptide chain release factor-like protein [Gammaproteobacteria bacterium]NIY19576.1 peptide chain release factor-like protein [Gammaproteobacteria bacterium]
MNEHDLRIDYFRGSGPGGQHRNTSETGVRITHLPTGVVATATESRSRHMNLKKAMSRLEEKIAARQKKRRPRIKTRPGKAAVARRLELKRKQSEKKRGRKKVID